VLIERLSAGSLPHEEGGRGGYGWVIGFLNVPTVGAAKLLVEGEKAGPVMIARRALAQSSGIYESTVRYLGIEVDDALSISKQVEL
jgi:hypothetical protein